MTLFLAAGAMCLSTATGADLAEAVRLYQSGDYADCIKQTDAAIADREFAETWRVLRIDAQLALGQYDAAAASLKEALERYPNSIRLRWIGRTVHRFQNDAEKSAAALAEIGRLLQAASWRYRDPDNLTTLAHFFLAEGSDPKAVLGLFTKLKREHPDLPHGFVETGELALAKHDYGMAAEAYSQAAQVDPRNPAIFYGLAQAFAASDAEKAEAALQTALKLNPHHAPSLLLLAENQIDAEQYETATATLERVTATNPSQPEAWAYAAVLAHLANDAVAEKQARQKALEHWKSNPMVDHLIGKKLSQKYRFAEGAAHQRQALEFDPKHRPAKMQLCQDLLRLGEEEEGWRLAAELFDEDNYNVVAHNLSVLHDRLTGFTILKSPGFVVRMEAVEAKVYGARVLDLLRRAREQLPAKYEATLEEPIYVDIYPRQQDFAIRTFGLPGGAGFLGVCFGRVVTMNSPASHSQSPPNWEAVLWHEYCHVATLAKTNNKMPRWLSEGISVYEERQADPTWGESLNPVYRRMILGGELTPVSQLSSAFLSPPSGLHLQFAYYESSLAVEYLIEKYGIETLRRILVDLGAGMPINESLQRYAGSIDAFDQEFAAYAQKIAEDLAPEADFSEPDLPPEADQEALAAWLETHPDNWIGLRRMAGKRIAAKQWTEAAAVLEQAVALYPDDRSSDSTHGLLARVYRELGEPDKEQAALVRWAELSDDALPAYLRLLEIHAERKEWAPALRYARRALAVNPLLKAPQRGLAEAATQQGDREAALAGWSALLELDPLDPADLHYQIGRLYFEQGDLSAARRHTLLALEEAPRFRDAHRLLLEIVEPADEPPSP